MIRKMKVEVLIPTRSRTNSLAVMLASLIGQAWTDYGVTIAWQNPQTFKKQSPLAAVIRVLEALEHPVRIVPNWPQKGMAQQRQLLLDQSRAAYIVYIDDDLILEPLVLARLMATIEKERCGMVGAAPVGLSFIDEVRPQEQQVEWWETRVMPEKVMPQGEHWERYRLHNAANLWHLAHRLRLKPDEYRCYKVAWVGGCVMFDREKLRAVGGFHFWKRLPKEHAGEDVLAQLKVMERFGGCGLLPSGVYHQELPTTIRDRRVDAPTYLEG
jgi:glycosyltransferase involved in cell wall biosynthesis